MQIVDEILFKGDDVNTWINNFCKKGGMQHLFNALINFPIISMANSLARECFWYLVVDLEIIMVSEFALKDYVKDYEACKDKMMERILNVMNEHAKYEAKAKNVKESVFESEEIAKFDSSLILCGFSLIKEGKKNEYKYFEQVIKFKEFNELLLNGLILTQNQQLQLTLIKEILNLYTLSKGDVCSDVHPVGFMASYILQVITKDILKHNIEWNNFYNLVQNTFNRLTTEDLERLSVDYKKVLGDISECIKSFTIKSPENLVTGVMALLNKVLEMLVEMREFVGQDCKLTIEILQNWLFNLPQIETKSKTVESSKCNSKVIQNAAFNLLSTLCYNCPSNISTVINYLTPIHVNASWRTNSSSDWSITPEIEDKSITGYVGIKNLGSICYMNSLLQQFYMIPSFRAEILAAKEKGEVNEAESVLYQTQYLFASLKESKKQYYDPKYLCRALKDENKKSLAINVQMDADEFINLFFDQLEASLKGTKHEKMISKFFGGVFANQLLCKDCPHSSVRKEPFLALNLQIKNKKSLEECLDSFVEGEILQGENAYYCDKCDKKVNTLKRTYIKTLPRHLICVLKRFDMNYDKMKRFKVNNYCRFPMRLNMKTYTEEGIKEKDMEKAKQEGREVKEFVGKQHPEEYYEYKLVGIVIHLGTAEVGHYYSYILDREKEELPEEERWFEFNDATVKKYDPRFINVDSFGAADETIRNHVKNLLDNTKNAYILFYERIGTYDPPAEEDEKENSKEEIKWVKEVTVPEKIYKEIVVENSKFLYNKFIFQFDYFKFVLNLGLLWNSEEIILEKYPSKNQDYFLSAANEGDLIAEHSYQVSYALPSTGPPLKHPMAEVDEVSLSIAKYVLTVLLTALIRSNDKKLLYSYIDLCKAYLNKHEAASQWLLKQFSNEKVLGEFLFDLNNPHLRRLVVGLFYCAMLKCNEVESAAIKENNVKESVLLNFAFSWVRYLPICYGFSKSSDQFFQIMSRIVNISPEIRFVLLKKGLLEVLLKFWQSDLSLCFKLGEWKWVENDKPELGMPYELSRNYRLAINQLKSGATYEPTGVSSLFLSETISVLLRSVALNKKFIESPFSMMKAENWYPPEDYVRDILMNSKAICDLIIDCTSNLAVINVSKALACISWKDESVKNVIMKSLVMSLEGITQLNIKKYFHFLRDLINTKDSLQNITTDKLMRVLLDSIDNVSKDKVACIIKLLLWSIHELPEVKEWLKENKDYIDLLQEKNAMITNNISRKTLMKCIEELKEGKEFDLEEHIDGVETMYYNKLLVDDEVRYYDMKTKKWRLCSVNLVLDEMICLSDKDESIGWIEVESDCLGAPFVLKT